ncbi:MAG: 5'-deoxynucleotidase, partial [Clostridia bacterium]|nr:5'-deoxynucleotidase [Clostridia bacterium]
KLVKAADKIAAYVKCVDEIRLGNDEFIKAKEANENSIKTMALPEADIFMREFAPAYSLTLFEHNL